MFYQHTLKSTAKFSGVGLHTGRTITMEIQPARENTGLVFARKTAEGLVEIPAVSKNVVETRLATVLADENGLRISTVEHVLAALAGMEIDNAKVIVDGPEIPILDGSSAPIVEGILRAGGAARQTQARKFLVVRKAVRVFDEESSRWASLEPARGFELDCTIDFDHPLIRNQRIEFELSASNFISEISGARTFGFAKDVERMRQAGLALGGSLDNAIVIDDFSVQNPDGLRFPNEFVRHKLLDAIGDLALLGAPLIGRYVGVCSGHMLNDRPVKALLERENAFEITELGTLPPPNSRRRKEGPSLGLRDALVLS